MQAAIPQRAGVHAEETGWREKKKNGDVWTFSTLTARYCVRGGPTKEISDAVLGPHFPGVLGSASSVGDYHHPGSHPRCWAPLLRDIPDLLEVDPSD